MNNNNYINFFLGWPNIYSHTFARPVEHFCLITASYIEYHISHTVKELNGVYDIASIMLILNVYGEN